MSAVARDAFVPFAEARGSELARARGESTEATFNFTVSEAFGTEVPRQIAEAEEFVRANHQSLAALIACSGVQSGVLDFGCEIDHRSSGTWLRWPRSLVAACGDVGLELEVSIYVIDLESSK